MVNKIKTLADDVRNIARKAMCSPIWSDEVNKLDIAAGVIEGQQQEIERLNTALFFINESSYYKDMHRIALEAIIEKDEAEENDVACNECSYCIDNDCDNSKSKRYGECVDGTVRECAFFEER